MLQMPSGPIGWEMEVPVPSHCVPMSGLCRTATLTERSLRAPLPARFALILAVLTY